MAEFKKGIKTIPELSAETAIPATTLRDAAKRQAIPAQKFGRDWFVSIDDVKWLTWLAAHPNQSRVKGKARSAAANSQLELTD